MRCGLLVVVLPALSPPCFLGSNILLICQTENWLSITLLTQQPAFASLVNAEVLAPRISVLKQTVASHGPSTAKTISEDVALTFRRTAGELLEIANMLVLEVIHHHYTTLMGTT